MHLGTLTVHPHWVILVHVTIPSSAGTTEAQRGKQLTLGHTVFAESELFALWELVVLGGRRRR